MYVERQQQNRYDWKQPDWSSGEWLDLLESCIRDNKPAEFLTGVAMSSTTGYYHQVCLLIKMLSKLLIPFVMIIV